MIDPTGRSAHLPKQKLTRLVTLLAGVFIVGCGIGWLFGQIGAPSNDSGAQRAATTLVAPPTVAPDTLAQVQPGAAVPAVIDTASASAAAATPTAASVPPVVVESSPASPPGQPDNTLPVVVPPPASIVSPAPASVTVAPVAMRHHAGPKHVAKFHHVKHRRDQVSRRRAASGAVTVIGDKSAPKGARWIVQLGAFRTHDHAALLVMTLQAHGTRAAVIKRDRGATGVWYLVQTPAIASLSGARAQARTLAAREKLSVSVLRTR